MIWEDREWTHPNKPSTPWPRRGGPISFNLMLRTAEWEADEGIRGGERVMVFSIVAEEELIFEASGNKSVKYNVG